MGVGVSRSRLAGAVAKEGGVGIISTAQIGYDEPDFDKDQATCNLAAVKKHIQLAKKQAQGDLDNGLIFCDANVGRIDKILTVHELMNELTQGRLIK